MDGGAEGMTIREWAVFTVLAGTGPLFCDGDSEADAKERRCGVRDAIKLVDDALEAMAETEVI